MEQTVEQQRCRDELDRKLIARFRDGDPSAFDEIVLAYQGRVTRLVSRMTDRSSDIEDLVQDVFVSALANLHKFRGHSKLSTWLSAIALNRCRSYRRRNLFNIRSWLRITEKEGNNEVTQGAVESSETHAFVRDAVNSLPAKYREPIILRYFEGLSVTEIAKILGSRRGTVEVRLSRARSKLKEKLTRILNED